LTGRRDASSRHKCKVRTSVSEPIFALAHIGLNAVTHSYV